LMPGGRAQRIAGSSWLKKMPSPLLEERADKRK
jgi:hypothetical protein